MFDFDEDDRHENGIKLMDDTTAAKRMEMHEGINGLWITLRRNDLIYGTIKFISVIIAFVFAGITMSLKHTASKYANKDFTENVLKSVAW